MERPIKDTLPRESFQPVSFYEEAVFIVDRSELENLWPVLDELVEEGHIEHDAQKGVYRIKRGVFSLVWAICMVGAMNSL